MTTTTPAVAHRTDVLDPAVPAVFGATVFALSLLAGEVLDLTSGAHTASEWALTAGIAVVGGVIAAVVGRRSLRGTPAAVARTALVLAVVAAVTVVVFWAGWSHVFGAVAVGLAVEARRRSGRLTGASGTALVVGALAFVAATVFCVIG